MRSLKEILRCHQTLILYNLSIDSEKIPILLTTKLGHTRQQSEPWENITTEENIIVVFGMNQLMQHPLFFVYNNILEWMRFDKLLIKRQLSKQRIAKANLANQITSLVRYVEPDNSDISHFHFCMSFIMPQHETPI